MKSVLITGASGYIATMLGAYLRERGYTVRAVNLRGDLPEESYHGFDTVVHAAGLAHRKEQSEDAALYLAVNRDLAVTAATAAREQGVRQFIYLSSMSVYGLYEGRITKDTPPAPATGYGKSKLAAEEALKALETKDFHVALLRPPMVYGPGCKGNYPRLAKLVLLTPVFPRVRNERSMLYIDCLCGFLRRLIESGEGGLYFPQNKEYVTTDELARQVAKAHGKRLWQPRGLGWLLAPLSKRIPTVGKVFGTLTYDMDMSAAFSDEPQPDFAETIRVTEGVQNGQ